MKHVLLFGLMLASFLSYSQYPASGVKQRLGWQTTGDGLVYRGAIADTSTLDPSGLNNAWMLLDTVNGSLYAYRSKAWQLVSGGGGVSMPFDSVTFNINEGDASEQELKYSAEKGYLQYGGLDSVQIPLLPGIWYVRNDDSVTVSKGMVVRASGTLGASGRIKVKRMIADGSIPAMYVLGIAMHDIASGADGYVMTQGKIRQVNTQAYSEGAVLYADVDTLGGLTQTEPTGSNLKLPIAFVVHSASNGTLAVRVSPGTYLRDLHDVYITSPDSNASLYYNTSESVWRDTTPAVLTSDTSVFARDFQISGTANYLAKFTGANTIGNSGFIENGQEVYLGGTTNAFNFSRFSIYYNPVNNGFPIVADTRAYNASPLPGAGWNFGGKKDSTGAYTAFGAIQGAKETSANSEAGYLQFSTNSDGGSAFPEERMRITSAGNVGIANNTPTNLLDVGSTSTGPTSTIGIKTNTVAATTKVAFENGISVKGDVLTTSNATVIGTGGMAIQTTTNHPIIFRTNSSGVESGGNERMRILEGGNVGIATSSPSRPLHVAGTTAIRIPVGNLAERGTSDNGDIRVRTDTASMEYYSGAWRTVAPMARVPQSGLANRFSKFNADGLLDTSAILIQANNRIGIFNSPAAGDSALTVTGGIRATTGVRATLLNVNTSGTQVLSINNYSGNPNASPNNVFIGNGGQSTTGTGTQGRSNIGIGANALLSITTGEGSIGIGTNTMATRAQIMQSNIAIGSSAMQFQGSVQNNDNTAIGTNALRYNKGGNYNVALGSNALTQNTTSFNNDTAGVNGGSNNFGLGFQACYWNGTGLQNVGIGSSANYANRNGSYNIAIGGQALAGGTSAADTAAKSSNVAIGANSLEFLKGNGAGNSDENVAIGYHAGRSYGSGAGTNFTAGKTSVYIGAYTRANANTNENEIAIGYGTIGNGSNTTTISNGSTTHNVFQYGEMLFGYAKSADVGDYRVQVNGNGYVSGEFRIGYTADQGAYPLQVNGQIFATNATIATSDARLKQDIEPLKSGLKEVLSLNPVTYTFKPDTVNNYPKGKQVGFLAQEIKATVQGDYAGSIVQEAGGYLGVADTKLIPLLVKAIQEQQAQIEALKKEIEALKNK